MTTRAEIAAIIDHTLLTPEATGAQVADLIAQADRLGVCAVCVCPSRLPNEEIGRASCRERV